jgi:hypothetical protein
MDPWRGWQEAHRPIVPLRAIGHVIGEISLEFKWWRYGAIVCGGVLDDWNRVLTYENNGRYRCPLKDHLLVLHGYTILRLQRTSGDNEMVVQKRSTCRDKVVAISSLALLERAKAVVDAISAV